MSFTSRMYWNRWFSRSVIAAVLVDGKQKDRSLAPFVCPPAFVHFIIVICVPRDCMKTTYNCNFIEVMRIDVFRSHSR